MFRIVSPALALLHCLAPLAASAGDHVPQDPAPAECVTTADKTNCTPLLARVGITGLAFKGRADGRGTGTLRGTLSDGTPCAGTWTERNFVGLGQADVTCRYGKSARVIFYYQDRYTGTAIGEGVASDGSIVRTWSGDHIADFMRKSRGKAALPCGPRDVPVS